MARCKLAVQVSAVADDPRLVQRGPHLDATVEATEHGLRILRKPLRDVRIEPSAAIVECCGQIPVKERRCRLDAVLEQAVDETLVEIETGCVNLTRALRKDA